MTVFAGRRLAAQNAGIRNVLKTIVKHAAQNLLTTLVHAPSEGVSMALRNTVVHVTPYYPPHLGGVERVASALAESSAARFDVRVVTSAIGDGDADECAGVLVQHLPAREFAHTPLPVRRLFWALLKLPRKSILHVHVAHAVWPEVVALAAAIRRFPVVAHFHLDVAPSGRAGSLLPFYKKHFLGRVMRAADAVIALTERQAAEIIDRYKLDARRVHVIGNGVDRSYTELPDRDSGLDSRLRVLFVGRLDPQKNVPRLLRALARTTADIDAVIVGSGEDETTCTDLLLELGLENVRMVGAQFGERLLQWYAWADVFVMTSDSEGMPLALLEAMASGLAVVAGDVSDLRLQVGEAGLVVAPTDDAIADALDRIAAHPALLQELRTASRARGAGYSWDPLVARIEDIYEQVRA